MPLLSSDVDWAKSPHLAEQMLVVVDCERRWLLFINDRQALEILNIDIVQIVGRGSSLLICVENVLFRLCKLLRSFVPPQRRVHLRSGLLVHSMSPHDRLVN